jgi:hypothetical protein
MSSTPYIGTSVEKAESVCTAHTLSPPQRQALAISVLEGSASVSALSRDQGVSRKFLYQQAHKAQGALEDAFAPSPEDEEVLFWLPVTKAWLRQLVLALVLICHASFRGVVELFRDLLDTKLSVGSVHNIVHQAVVDARAVNTQEDLSGIEVGAHDEIFQSGTPVLVGCDVGSTYCYLLAPEEARDRTTWGVHLPRRPLPCPTGDDPTGHVSGQPCTVGDLQERAVGEEDEDGQEAAQRPALL